MLLIVEQTREQGLSDIAKTNTKSELNIVRIKYLGRKGLVSKLMVTLPQLSKNDRPLLGKKINTTKAILLKSITERATYLDNTLLQNKIKSENVDVTLPGLGQNIGSLHPITSTVDFIERFFLKLGFSITYGPEIEDYYHNFDALNINSNHPARSTQDTFYLSSNSILRTHTSGVQIRMMEKQGVPIRIISPGRVYRCDSDATHTPMFHQVEGLWVDENISFVHLKSILHQFLIAFFVNKDLKVRFRSSYFPFTEPSAEIDISCIMCGKQEDCRVCKNTGWLEVLGCGMVRPEVFNFVSVDHRRYQGFAFGMGVERLAMLRYGIEDLRMFFENDLRFLKQF